MTVQTRQRECTAQDAVRVHDRWRSWVNRQPRVRPSARPNVHRAHERRPPNEIEFWSGPVVPSQFLAHACRLAPRLHGTSAARHAEPVCVAPNLSCVPPAAAVGRWLRACRVCAGARGPPPKTQTQTRTENQIESTAHLRDTPLRTPSQQSHPQSPVPAPSPWSPTCLLSTLNRLRMSSAAAHGLSFALSASPDSLPSPSPSPHQPCVLTPSPAVARALVSELCPGCAATELEAARAIWPHVLHTRPLPEPRQPPRAWACA